MMMRSHTQQGMVTANPLAVSWGLCAMYWLYELMRKELNMDDVIATISGPAMASKRCG